MSYECLNPNCFYCEALLSAGDCTWVHFWNSAIDDIDFRPKCPSCAEPMAAWDDNPTHEVNDGTLQALLPLKA